MKLLLILMLSLLCVNTVTKPTRLIRNSGVNDYSELLNNPRMISNKFFF